MKMRITKLSGLLVAAIILSTAFAMAEMQGDLSNTDIANAVDDALVDDTAVSAQEINVDTTEGIVTLTGSVKNIQAKDRAGEIAETIKGVRGVINRIQVAAPFRSDTKIKEDVQDALLRDPATESWEISTSVDNGTVTLGGAVDSWHEKQLAAKVAKGVRGVKGVVNDISVDYETERVDLEIEKEIEKALRWNAYVDDTLIVVEVDDGEVELSGTVSSLAEKNEAFSEAWVAGVEEVDNKVDVESWARDGRFREDKYVAKSDSEIEDAVQDAFLYDPRVNTYEIDADIDAGYVTLRGTVDNLNSKRAAAQDARRVLGVWGVDNRIKVRMEEQPTDDRIASNVEDALDWDPYVERYEIDVSVEDGEVYLYGDVDSTFEKAQADDVTSRQPGVIEVHNFLTVEGPRDVAYGPYEDDWFLGDYEWYAPPEFTTAEEDWKIEHDIEDEIFWSPFVDSDKVDVEVENGVVELTGTVETWKERQAATEEAWEGGAGVVANELEVEYGPDYHKPESED